MAVQEMPFDAETFGTGLFISTGSRVIPKVSPKLLNIKDDEQQSLCGRETLIVYPHCIFSIYSTPVIQEGRNSRLTREVPHGFRF
jgi:hypothetical protein